MARFHYRYPDDIRTIMRNCARDGFNTVLWQVRGEGTVLYPSRIEPWSAEYGYRDPGFDPLRLAVEEAHRNGLRIEPWVNVMPGWKGPKPPPVRSQLWHAHPDWFLRDAAGARQPLGKFYVILNPCLPEVRHYIASVIEEIVANYDVDGVHLDYVRYAWETTPNARDFYPRDPTTLSVYRQQTGRHPDDNPRECAGLVNAVMPMAYSAQLDDFERYIGAYRQLGTTRRIVPGLGLYKHETAEQTGRQLGRCRGWGGDFALFSYDSLHATAGDRGRNGKARVDASKKHLRQMRTGVVRRFATD